MGLFRKKPPEAAEIHVESKTIDASNMGDLREEILDTLKEHGIEPGKPQVINASDVPGLSEEIMGELNKAGVWQQAFAGLGALGAAAGEHDDPVGQLEKLAELHKKGVLSDYEFAVAKQKLLEERWDSSS
jgi:putative oligomerization/nucleic acid binding protein